MIHYPSCSERGSAAEHCRYRLTGDRKWQEKGWKMFVSWSQASKVDGGFSSIYDVTHPEYYHSDNMESFMFAETLK